MDNEKRKYWFFGSKLNTILLLVLIILMIVALRWMREQRDLYIPEKKNTPVAVVEGTSADLIAFSIDPGETVSGKVTITGALKGGYFFEGNLPFTILDAKKQPTSYGPGHATATTDWMTGGSVSFSTQVDFTKVPKGNYYIKLTQDDPSGGESGRPIRSVLIPIVVN